MKLDQVGEALLKARRRFLDVGAVALLLALVIVFFSHVIFSDRMIYGRDTVEQGYPLVSFIFSQVRAGEPPIWNPYMMSGTPMYSSAPLRPLTLLSLGASPKQIINRLYVCHVLLACLLMFALMRRWSIGVSGALVAALAFGFSGFFIPKIFAGHAGAFGSGVWIPLVFLLLDKTLESRRPVYAILTGGVFGLQILGEHPQYVFYTLLAMIAFGLYRVWPIALRPLKTRVMGVCVGLICLIGLFAAGTAAVYILPFAQLTSLSSRGGGTGYEYSSSLSLPPANALTAIAPNIWGSPVWKNSVMGAIYWDSSLYIGVIPLMLALIAMRYSRHPRSAYFKWLAVVSVLLALGGYTPLYRLLYHVPGFSLMRVPAKALILYAFAMSILAGYGIETLWAMARRQARRLALSLLIATGAMAVAAVAFWAAKPWVMSYAEAVIRDGRSNSVHLLQNLPGLYALQSQGLWTAFVFTAVGALLIQSIATKTSVRLAPAVLIIVVFIDLAIFGRPLVQTIDLKDAYRSGAAEAAFLQRQKGLFRVLPIHHYTFIYAQSVLNEIQSVNGYYPVYPRRYAEFVAAANERPVKVDVSADIHNYRSPLLDLLNVRYVISETPLSDKSLRLVFHKDAYIYERDTLPRAFLVHSAELAAGPDAALQRVRSPGFDARKDIVIEAPSVMPVARFAGMKDSVKVTRYSANGIDLDVTAAAPGYLFLSETNYPGWKAELDREPVPVLQANHLFRSVYVRAGEHKVTVHYDPWRRRWGERLTVVFALSVALVCVGALVRRLRNRAPDPLTPALPQL